MRPVLRPSEKSLFENHCENEPLVYKNDLFVAPVWGGTSNRGPGGGWRMLVNARLRPFLKPSGKGLFENHCENEPLVYKNDLFLAPVWGGTSNRGPGGGWRRVTNGRYEAGLEALRKESV